MELSTIIVTWNSAYYIRNCLDSVIQELEGVESEIIVIDNHSSDDTPQIVKRDYPHITLVKNKENAGFGAANNTGIRLSSGEFVLALNPDTISHPGAIQTMLRFIKDNPQVGMVGPEQLNGRGSVDFNFSRYTWRGILEYVLEKLAPESSLASRFRTPYETKYLNGSCWLVRREIFETSGLYDENLFLYGEEPDMCRRVRCAGWKLFFLRNVAITHFRAGSVRLIGWRKYPYVIKSFSKVLAKLLPQGNR